MKKYFNKLLRQSKQENTVNYHDEAQREVELLLKDCNSIDTSEMADFEKKLTIACKKRGYTKEYTEAILSHRYRYFLTNKMLKDIFLDRKEKGINILEMGGDGPFTDILKREFPKANWHSTTGDLRIYWGIKDNSLDLVLSNEVLEHLSDLPHSFQETFYGKGLKATLHEAYKALKKGGLLFITTPNASSINIVSNVLAGEAPWFFPLHIREYTMKELIIKLEEEGFEVIEAKSIHCMTYPLDVDWTRAFEALKSAGYDCSERGDDLFIICKKLS